VKAAPDLGALGATDYIRGLVPVADRMVVLLDIDRLIGMDIANLTGGAAPQAVEPTCCFGDECRGHDTGICCNMTYQHCDPTPGRQADRQG
jgi:hypothetical protein